MSFIDRVVVEVRSGKGGDGAIAFLHEKYIAKGDYSEDFADSVALYLTNQKSFSKKFANRTDYFECLIK